MTSIRSIFLLTFIFLASVVQGQDLKSEKTGDSPVENTVNATQTQEPEIEMADTMRSNGKIYVVLVNALIILGVLSVFLIRVDMRLKRLENETLNAKLKD